MKKGFTLIELLAVILILGIIALIAIPTVNNILKEAREGAFRTSSDNIMKSMEEVCQTSLIRGDNPVLSYIFTDGKSSSKLEVKGTMPNDGYVFLDRECSVTNFYLTDQNNTYTNGEDVRKDYMLKEPIDNNTSIFKSLYSSYYNNLLSINTVNHLNIPEGAIEIKDASVSEAGKIKSWLVQNGSNYDLYIGSEGKIYANYNSAYLFSGSSATSITFDNFYTDFVNNMNSLFSNGKFASLNVANFNVSNVKNMNRIFYQCTNITSLELSNWNTGNVENMSSIFQYCNNLVSVDISNWDTKKAKSIHAFFYNTPIEIIDISKWDLRNIDVTNIYSFSDIFGGDAAKQVPSTIYLPNIDIDKNVTLNDTFRFRNGLKYIHCTNKNNIEIFSQDLLTRSSSDVGYIITTQQVINTISEDVKTLLANKNWTLQVG